jgi:spoIIIJ-associated protein
MSSCLEFTGKDLESTVKKACEKLNLPKEKLKYDVISLGSTGVFGLVGTRKAKIRVTLSDPRSDVEKNTKEKEQHDDDSNEQTIDETDSEQKKDNENVEIQKFSNDPGELGREVLQRIIDIISSDSKIVVEEGSKRIFFNIEGGSPALLIGKHGQTLRAIRYIVDKIIRKQNKEKVRIEIDVEGYLKKRRADNDSRAKRK